MRELTSKFLFTLHADLHEPKRLGQTPLGQRLISDVMGERNALSLDKVLYRQRHRIEILFAKLKDWRRIATRYDRCAYTFFSAICIAATIIFWLDQ